MAGFPTSAAEFLLGKQFAVTADLVRCQQCALPPMWLLPLRRRFRLCRWLQSRQSESVTLNACEHAAEDDAMKWQYGIPVH